MLPGQPPSLGNQFSWANTGRRLKLCAQHADRPAPQSLRMDTCFNSSDPDAVNATQMFDFNVDNGDLWRRSGLELPHCLTPAPPPVSRCLVCLQDIVFAVCRDLPDGVKVIMEAGSHQVKLSRSECPKPPDEGAPQWQLAVLIMAVFFILGMLIFICWKYCRKC